MKKTIEQRVKDYSEQFRLHKFDKDALFDRSIFEVCLREFAEQETDRVLDDLMRKVNDLENEHPYKDRHNPLSYSRYNEAWSDCCDIVKSLIQSMKSNKEQ